MCGDAHSCHHTHVVRTRQGFATGTDESTWAAQAPVKAFRSAASSLRARSKPSTAPLEPKREKRVALRRSDTVGTSQEEPPQEPQVSQGDPSSEVVQDRCPRSRPEANGSNPDPARCPATTLPPTTNAALRKCGQASPCLVAGIRHGSPAMTACNEQVSVKDNSRAPCCVAAVGDEHPLLHQLRPLPLIEMRRSASSCIAVEGSFSAAREPPFQSASTAGGTSSIGGSWITDSGREIYPPADPASVTTDRR